MGRASTKRRFQHENVLSLSKQPALSCTLQNRDEIKKVCLMRTVRTRTPIPGKAYVWSGFQIAQNWSRTFSNTLGKQLGVKLYPEANKIPNFFVTTSSFPALYNFQQSSNNVVSDNSDLMEKDPLQIHDISTTAILLLPALANCVSSTECFTNQCTVSDKLWKRAVPLA